MNNNGIGVFDSGFGGLTVMRALIDLLPHEDIIYFGDTARLPYGNKSPETVLRYSQEIAAYLLEQKIKVLVIACNTASACALEALQASFPIPVIGVIEPAIDAAVRVTKNQKIAILGTRTTISSGVYQKQLSARLPEVELYPLACPLFVPIVEEGYIDHPLGEMVTKEYLSKLLLHHIDTIVLACTHYPLLETLIRSQIDEEIILVDSAVACAEQVRSLLTTEGLLNSQRSSPSYQFYVSDDPEKFCNLGKIFLNHPIQSAALVS